MKSRLLLCMVPILVLSACAAPLVSSSPTAGAPGESGLSSSAPSGSAQMTSAELTIAFNAGPETIDPAVAGCGFASDSLVLNLYDQLVDIGVTDGVGDPNVIVPRLAESWTISEDGLEYTFTLRRDATFSSGNPVTAEDVVYSLDRLLSVDGCAAYLLTGGLGVTNIADVVADGDYGVTVTLNESDPLFLYGLTLGIGIVDEQTLEANGGLGEDGQAWLGTHAAGSGPFTLESYDPTREIVLVARPDHWSGEPVADRITIRVASDAASLELLTTSGQVDVVYGLPLKDVGRIGDAPGLKLFRQAAFNFVNVGLNNAIAPLDDVRVRQALSYATPFDDIIRDFGSGFAQPLVGPIMNGQRFKVDLPNPYIYDPDKARALLTEAGVTAPRLSMIYLEGDSTQREIATVLQASWAQVGVTLDVQALGSAAFYDALDKKETPLYMVDDKSSAADPAFLLGYFVRCGDQFNWSQYCNENVDTWLEEARHSLDEERRAELYRLITEQFIEDAPYIQLYQKEFVVVADEAVTGYVAWPDTRQRFFTISK